MSQTTMLDHSKVDNMCIQTSPSSPREEYYLTLRGDDPASKQNNPGKAIHQSTARPDQHYKQLHRRLPLHPRCRVEYNEQ